MPVHAAASAPREVPTPLVRALEVPARAGAALLAAE